MECVYVILLKHMSACTLSISSYISFIPCFSTVKFKHSLVHWVDKLLYRSFLGILYFVLHVLSSINSWNLKWPFYFKETLVKIENLL